MALLTMDSALTAHKIVYFSMVSQTPLAQRFAVRIDIKLDPGLQTGLNWELWFISALYTLKTQNKQLWCNEYPHRLPRFNEVMVRFLG